MSEETNEVKVEGAEVVACINHDKNAIMSHKSNHPEALHFIEDIRTVSLESIIALVKKLRATYPGIKIGLWASLECTNHSNAKGGMSRDADSRTLAEHLERYFILDFDMIFIENVREFKDWGPLEHKHIDGIPAYDKKGSPIMVPIKALKGVDYERWVESIKVHGYNYEYRVLNCADYACPTSRKRLFIQFVKPEMNIVWPEPLLDKKDWLPVLPHIDLEKTGESIFFRKKPLADKTLMRIKRGLIKFKGDLFLQKYYSTGSNVQSCDQPCPTITTKDRVGIVQPFIIEQYGASVGTSVNSPCNTITTSPKQGVVQAFLTDTQFNNVGTSLNDPAPTLLACRKRNYLTTAFLMDHQFSNEGHSLGKPCPTIIARQDKKPMYVVSTKPGPLEVQESDTEIMRDLKEYCIINGIGDVRMRTLFTQELLTISTFPANYILVGTETEKKKYIGNAVPPKIAEELIKASINNN